MKIDCYRDGGTVVIEDRGVTLYIDHGIGSKTKGVVYYDYPKDENARKLSNLRNLMEAKEILEQAYEQSEYYLPTIAKGILWVENKISDELCPPEDFPCH
jgi:hypothetical protein